MDTGGTIVISHVARNVMLHVSRTLVIASSAPTHLCMVFSATFPVVYCALLTNAKQAQVTVPKAAVMDYLGANANLIAV